MNESNQVMFTLQSVMFSPHYTYACYLLFKFRDNTSVLDNAHLFKTASKLDGVSIGTIFIYRSTYPLNIPTIKPKKGRKDNIIFSSAISSNDCDFLLCR
jgi:hypothetical protein